MADHVTSALATSALTIAAVEAGIPLAAGFALAGVFGATVGHARWTLERERNGTDQVAVTIRTHICMLGRALLMSLFTSFLLLMLWLEYKWPWTWGMIVASLTAVVASDAIEWALTKLKARGDKLFGGKE